MARYEVFATRWDDPKPVERIPATGLRFSRARRDHGECSFSAAVEPGRSSWRAAVAAGVSGVLVTRDGVPCWSGWLTGARLSGVRAFEFTAVEWGAVFSRVLAVPRVWQQANDHRIIRDLIDDAQAVQGQDFKVVTGDSLGAAKSDLTIAAWDAPTVEEAIRRIGDADGGPDWWFDTVGPLGAPQRRLVLVDDNPAGAASPLAVLSYVEDTEAPAPLPSEATTVGLLSEVVPGGVVASAERMARRGGNVLAVGWQQDAGMSATQAVAIGSGEQAAQLRETVTSNLVGRGVWPRLTHRETYQDVTVRQTLRRHAKRELVERNGLVTVWRFTTLDDSPDWVSLPRNAWVRCELDTDVFGGERPRIFTEQALATTVNVGDDGVTVEWLLATRVEEV